MLLNFIFSAWLAVVGNCDKCQSWPIVVADPLFYKGYPTRGDLFCRKCGRQLQFKLYDGEPIHK